MRERTCRVCGCTDVSPCISIEDACAWMADDPSDPDYGLCSFCEGAEEDNSLPGQDDEPLVRGYTEGEANAVLRAMSVGRAR